MYTKYGADPYHARCWTRDSTFDVSAYAFPDVPVTATLLLYNVTNLEQYVPVVGPINMVGRGKFLIFRESSLRRNTFACPRLNIWERRAREWAEMKSMGQLQPVTAGPSASSAVDSRVNSGVSRPLKRTASVGPASPTSGKKQKGEGKPQPRPTKQQAHRRKIQDHGFAGQSPISITTSDPDFASDVEISSEVEIL